MEAPILLAASYLATLMIFSREKFLYSMVCATLFFAASAMEISMKIENFLLSATAIAALTATAFSPLKARDIACCAILALVGAFWLGMQEFVDGFVCSHALVAVFLALISRLLSDNKKRRTLCVSALLTSYVMRIISGDAFYVADIATAIAVAIIFTHDADLEISRQTLSTDFITIDSYGTS